MFNRSRACWSIRMKSLSSGIKTFNIKCAPGCAAHFGLAILLKEYREALVRSGVDLVSPGLSPSATHVV